MIIFRDLPIKEQNSIAEKFLRLCKNKIPYKNIPKILKTKIQKAKWCIDMFYDDIEFWDKLNI